MSSRKTLIITHTENDEVDEVAEFLTEADYFVLITEEIHSRYRFTVQPNERTFSIIDEHKQKTIHSGELASIWVASTKHIYNEGFENDDDLAVFNSREYSSLIDAVIAIAEENGCCIVNHPSVTNHAGDKIRQQLVAMRYGFRVPDQLITNRKETFAEADFARRAIFKPIHSSNLHSNPIDGELYIAKPIVITEQIYAGICSGELEIGVPHFQEKLEKITEYRVVVFDNKVYAFNITGEYGFDWRGYMPNIDFEPVKKFSNAKGCLAFVKELGIKLAAFDFVETAEGIYFIECNPPGYFLFCDPENKTGMISDFARYLLK
jgi:glutathione synthase/RimK-type ligase-like ATP-grasp enzyme